MVIKKIFIYLLLTAFGILISIYPYKQVSYAALSSSEWNEILLASMITPEDVDDPHPDFGSIYPPPVVGQVTGIYGRADGSLNDQIGASEAGFGWISPRPFKWNEIDPQRNGNYNWTSADEVIGKISAVGMRPFLILENDLMHDDAYNADWDLIANPSNLTAFSQWAAAVATRYEDEGVVISIWEEPDHDRKLGPIINGTQMATIITQTAAAIKTVAPEVLVVADGSLSPIAFLSGNTQNAFLEETIQAGSQNDMFEYIDGFTFHYQQGGQPPERVAEQYNLLDSWIELYAPGYNVPIFNTGAGYERIIDGNPYEDWDARSEIREHLMGFYLQMPMVITYTYNGSPWGITNTNNTVKYKAYDAFSTYLSTLSGYRFMQVLPSDNATHYYLLFSNGTNYAIAAWISGGSYYASPTTQDVVLPLPAGSGEVVGIYGDNENVSWDSDGLEFTISQEPKYLIFPHSTVPTPTPTATPTQSPTSTPTATPASTTTPATTSSSDSGSTSTATATQSPTATPLPTIIRSSISTVTPTPTPASTKSPSPSAMPTPLLTDISAEVPDVRKNPNNFPNIVPILVLISSAAGVMIVIFIAIRKSNSV